MIAIPRKKKDNKKRGIIDYILKNLNQASKKEEDKNE